jgi:hypothetical protein
MLQLSLPSPVSRIDLAIRRPLLANFEACAIDRLSLLAVLPSGAAL